MNRDAKYTLVVSACMLLSISVFGPRLQADTNTDELEVLTPGAVLESVWNHHPRLKQELIQLEEANARALTATGAFDMNFVSENRSYLDGFYSGNTLDNYVEVPIPQARGSLRGGYRVGQGTFPVYEDEYQTLEDGEWRLEGTVSLLRNFSIDERRLAVQLAQLDTDIAELQVDSSRLLLGQAALEQYWNWVILNKVEKVYAKLLEVAELRQRQLDARVKAGDLAAFEALDNRRTILQRKALLVKQRASARQAGMKLSLFVRNSSGKPLVPLQKQVPVKLPGAQKISRGADSLFAMAFKHRPDIHALNLEIEQLQSELGFYETRFLPELKLGGIVSRDYGSGSVSRDGTELKMLLGLEVPLQQRRNRGRVLEAQGKLQRARVARSFLEDQIHTAIELALIDIEQSLERHVLSLEERETTLELAKGEFSRFKTGDSNLLFLNIREIGAAEAEVKVYEALRASLVQTVNLAAVVGDFDLLSLK